MATPKKPLNKQQKAAASVKYTPPKMAQRTLEERDYDAALAAKAKAKQASKKPAAKKKP